MAEQHSGEGASTSGASVSSSDSTIELNIKTLDSRVFNFQVDKNMIVSSFKAKIADQIGVPVGQQRLIFRGKVLKDEHSLSEYYVENGDTLHLVERQPAQPQTSSGTADTSGNNGSLGNDASAGIPRSRIGQISHSVVLGTFNVGDQGEGASSDFTRVIGAVLNSLGVGNPNTANAAVGAQNAGPPNHSGPAPQGSDTEQGHGSSGVPNQAQSQFGQPFLSHPFQVPLFGAAVPPPSLSTPIPDSLSTVSEFISRMERVLSQNESESTSSSTGLGGEAATELPSNARGMPTPEALGVVLRHAERLLSGPVVSALSDVAGRLEREAGSTDVSLRSQIQSDSVRVGLTMQHLGALFLELGRIILMLRMGQSAGEAVVNAGPAVYISPSGPNPIMVQPFPHQISPLFNAPAVSAPNSGPNSGTPVPVGIIGGAPRNINIHIHAGTSLAPIVSAVGARTAGGEGGQGDRSGTPNAPGEAGAARMFPLRNVIAAAVPSLAATLTVSPTPNTSQPTSGVPSSQALDTAAVISEVNSRVRNLLENMRTDNQASSGQQNPVVSSSSDGSGIVTDTTDTSRSMRSEGTGGAIRSHCSVPELQAQEDRSKGQTSSHSDSSKSQTPCDSNKPADAREVPLGLGGGLQPKRRSQQSKSGEGGTSSSPDQSQRAIAGGQQILQSLLSQSTAGRTSSNNPGQTNLGFPQGLEGMQSNVQDSAGMQSNLQGSDGQLDVTGMMSQLLDSPALNGLLTGVSQQTGVGSPNGLRNMLQQFTQTPAMRSTVNQLAQQVDRDDFRNMFAGMGSGQEGGLDLSSMFQQMMPVVSQMLGGVSIQNEQVQNMASELPVQSDDRSFGQSSLPSGIQELAQRIAAKSSSGEIFHGIVQTAAELSGAGDADTVERLSGNQDLVDQFLEILRRDLLRRQQGNAASGDKS